MLRSKSPPMERSIQVKTSRTNASHSKTTQKRRTINDASEPARNPKRLRGSGSHQELSQRPATRTSAPNEQQPVSLADPEEVRSLMDSLRAQMDLVEIERRENAELLTRERQRSDELLRQQEQFYDARLREQELKFVGKMKASEDELEKIVKAQKVYNKTWDAVMLRLEALWEDSGDEEETAQDDEQHSEE